MNLISKGISWSVMKTGLVYQKDISYHDLHVILNYYINYSFQPNFHVFNNKFGNIPQTYLFIIYREVFQHHIQLAGALK